MAEGLSFGRLHRKPCAPSLAIRTLLSGAVEYSVEPGIGGDFPYEVLAIVAACCWCSVRRLALESILLPA